MKHAGITPSFRSVYGEPPASIGCSSPDGQARVIAFLGDPATHGGAACETEVEPGLHIWGNAVRLRQLLLNLGENAVEFTPAGGRIRIEATSRDGAIVTTVSDTGSGISADLLPHVFDRHVHGHSQGGNPRSGLGLAIVKRIVDAHGGKITLHSIPGEGTTALVILPMA
ncbi:MAG: HAMP domain-containing histidine kinase [Cyanobacteria bacterium]|nr:HAMP domain-containing histidine kinase [Cyanobacteriota bacterium]